MPKFIFNTEFVATRPNVTEGYSFRAHGTASQRTGTAGLSARDDAYRSGRIEVHVAIFPDECPRCRIELAVERVRCEGMTRKPRTAHDHAVEGEMDSFPAERADNFVLEIVKRDGWPSDREGSEIEERELAQSAEAIRHAGFQHPVHGERIVGVDVIRQAGLPAGEPIRGRSG